MSCSQQVTSTRKTSPPGLQKYGFHMILVKNCNFLEIMFFDHPVRKQAFLDERDIDFTHWTYWNCFKGVNPSFCSKIGKIFISVLF